MRAFGDMTEGAEGNRTGGRDLRLPRQARITASSEIRALFRRGKRKRTRHLDVFFSASPAPFPRLGVVVAKHRQKVVKRNLLKRRLREIGRTLLLPRLREADGPLDVLVRTRPEAYRAEFADLREELQQVAEELCSKKP
jgi:ribonuclease P protein component